MSPALLRALVLSEDKRFYQHSGIDWSAVANSAWGNLWNTRTRGASTLTMQLAGLLEPDLARPVGGRSVMQKIDQAWIATRLERHWTKAQIIEAYLNRVNWRGEIVGVGALAGTLFAKRPGGLDLQGRLSPWRSYVAPMLQRRLSHAALLVAYWKRKTQDYQGSLWSYRRLCFTPT